MDVNEFKKEFDKLVKESPRILITSHMRPDDDAIGSVLTMYSYINKLFKGKEIDLIFLSSPAENFQFLSDYKKITWQLENPDFSKYDLVIMLDGNSLDRFFRENADLTKNKTICIDHHLHEGESFNLMFIDKEKSATCELLYNIFFEQDEKLLDKDNIEYLMVGIIGDTGGLTYLWKGKSEVLNVVAKLIEIGDLDFEIEKNKLTSFNIDQFEILKIFINNTVNQKLNNNPGVSYSYLSKSLGNRDENPVLDSTIYGALILRQIKDFPWGFTVVSLGNNEFKISFRSLKGAPNVRLICEKYFQGGGHDKAAGGKYISDENIDSDEVCRRIIELIDKEKLTLID